MRDTAVFVDDCEGLRRLVTLLMESEPGLRCLSFASLGDLQAHAEEVLASCVAILDINLGVGQPDGIAVYDWLKSRRYQGKCFFFTGHGKDSPQVRQAARTGAQVLEKPMSAESLVTTLRHAIDEGREWPKCHHR